MEIIKTQPKMVRIQLNENDQCGIHINLDTKGTWDDILDEPCFDEIILNVYRYDDLASEDYKQRNIQANNKDVRGMDVKEILKKYE